MERAVPADFVALALGHSSSSSDSADSFDAPNALDPGHLAPIRDLAALETAAAETPVVDVVDEDKEDDEDGDLAAFHALVSRRPTLVFFLRDAVQRLAAAPDRVPLLFNDVADAFNVSPPLTDGDDDQPNRAVRLCCLN